MPDPIAAVSGNDDHRQTLIVVFLRGAADGLTLVPPVGDDNYFAAAHESAWRRRTPSRWTASSRCIRCSSLSNVCGTMAIWPSFTPLGPRTIRAHTSMPRILWSTEASPAADGSAAFCASATARRNRLYPPLPWARSSRNVCGERPRLPSCSRWTIFRSARNRTIWLEDSHACTPRNRISSPPPAAMLNALARIERMRTSVYRQEHGAECGKDSFSLGLLQAAQLIKAQVGLEAASLDLENWDSHFTQSTIMNPLMVLATGLAAFYADLGPAIEHTTVMVMTEFGRRVQENSAFGTDHGMASVMFLIGGAIRGGRVIGKWPGLAADFLTGPSDVQVVHNYRDVIAPILLRQRAGPHLSTIFPDFQLHPLDVL